MALNLCPWATVCCKPSVGQALMMRVTLLSLLEKPSKHVATDQGVWYMPRRPNAPALRPSRPHWLPRASRQSAVRAVSQCRSSSGPRSPRGRVRPRCPSLGVGASDPQPSPTPPPAPARAAPLSGASPPRGPLEPTRPSPWPGKRSTKAGSGSARPSHKHRVPAVTWRRSDNFDSPRPTSDSATAPHSPRRASRGPHSLFEPVPFRLGRLPSSWPGEIGSTLLPPNTHTCPARPPTPCPHPHPAITGQLPARRAPPHPERTIPRRRPRPRPLCLGDRDGGGGAPGASPPAHSQASRLAAPRKQPASSRPPQPGTPGPPPPGRAANLAAATHPAPGLQGGRPPGGCHLEARGAPRWRDRGRRTPERRAARAGRRPHLLRVVRPSVRPFPGWRGRRRGALGGAR